MSVTRDAVLACLKTLNDPVSGKEIVELGLVKALTVDDGAVRFVLEVNPSHADAYAKLRDEADAAVGVARRPPGARGGRPGPARARR